VGRAIFRKSEVSHLLRLGIVGTGRMADTMMTAFRHVPQIEVRAVASREQSRARDFAVQHGIRSAFSSVDDLLAQSDLEAVYIANVNSLHARTAIQAMQAGKAVLCEKPFANSVEEGETVLQAAKTTGRVFVEAMWTTHLPAYRRLFELLTSGDLGEAIHLQADFGYPTVALPSPGPGSGVLLDRGVYPISLAIHLFGAPVDVQATVRRSSSGVDVSASVQLRHHGGQQSQLACSFESFLGNSATVSCSAGHAKLLSPLVGCQAVFSRRMQPLASGQGTSAASFRRRIKDALGQFQVVQRLRPLLEGKTEGFPHRHSAYLPMLRHFVAMIHRRDESRLANDQAISLEVLRVVDRARQAPTKS
jgi:predicted dehydrogenase